MRYPHSLIKIIQIVSIYFNECQKPFLKTTETVSEPVVTQFINNIVSHRYGVNSDISKVRFVDIRLTISRAIENVISTRTNVFLISVRVHLMF